MTNNIIAVILTTILSIVFATLSYYIIEPFIAGRKASLFGIDLDLTPYRHIVLYVFSGLTLITVLISLFAPAVGNFEKDLEANGLSQAPRPALREVLKALSLLGITVSVHGGANFCKIFFTDGCAYNHIR